MSNISKVKDKLTKLLALSEDSAASAGEIENALAMAGKLMAKHNVAREDLDTSSSNPTENVSFNQSVSFCLKTLRLAWEMDLARFVTEFIPSADYYITKGVPVRRNGMAEVGDDGQIRLSCAITFYGPKEDSLAAMELYDELQTVIQAMALIRWASFSANEGAGYAEGFVYGLRESQMKATKKLSNEDGGALILVSSQNALILRDGAKLWLAKEKGIKLKSGAGVRSKSKGWDGASYGEGRADGKNYNPSKPTSTKKIG